MRLTCLFLALICILFFPKNVIAKSPAIFNLKTEYTRTPIGIDIEKPRFSWQMFSTQRAARQTAYSITVVDESGNITWKSGKIKSDKSLNIKYQGSVLKASTRYSWMVDVWDQNYQIQKAQSWFETGLMSHTHGSSGWHGAKWIGTSPKDVNFYSAYLPVFKLSYAIQLDGSSGSNRAGFVFGANDPRLMDRNKNAYSLQNEIDSSYIMLEMDLSGLDTDKTAKLHIYRSGYSLTDNRNKPIQTLNIPASLIKVGDRYKKHLFYIECVLGNTSIYLNGYEKKNLIGQLNLNPLGSGGDFIAFPVCGDIGFSVPLGQKARFSEVTVSNYRHPSNILFKEDLTDKVYKGIYSRYNDHLRIENSVYSVSGRDKAALLIADPSHGSMPMLRTDFNTNTSKISKARLYVSARGIYDIYVNGKRIGKDYFNPGLSQYNKTQFYQTYDVTKDLNEGKNSIGAIMGEGWWSGASTFIGEFWNFFGDRQSLLAQLIITYKDGSTKVITTQPGSWKYYDQGPAMCGSFFQGEVYDATKAKAVAGWSKPTYQSRSWKPAMEILLANTINADSTNQNSGMPMVNDYSKQSMTGQYGQTVQKVRELTAVGVEEIRPGVFIYDMGQNMAGVPSIRLTDAKPGQRIVLRFAEVKYPDLPEYKDQKGMLMLENIRAAMAQDIYIARGGEELIEPRFTYHGYRYVEVTGLKRPLDLSDVKATVLSSVHSLTSSYRTSSKDVNKLWENITWSMLSNFISIPTDCPQRNERLGWSGDISVFSKTASYLADLPQFLRRHMQAMRDVQRNDGRFSDVAPLGGGFGGVLWGSAGINVAWESYQQYGDEDLLAEHYGAMKHYIEYLITEIDPKSGILNEKDRDKWASLGDWLSPEYAKTEKALLWDAYFISNLEQMSKMALVLKEVADQERFEKLLEDRKRLFATTYLKDGRTSFRGRIVDTQASYVLPLSFDIFKGEQLIQARKNLELAVRRSNIGDDGKVAPPYSLMTGFIGTSLINTALSESGYTDVAYRLLQQTSYPSWIYPVKQGATTIWERLNSFTHSDGFGGNNRMNSFNHYSFGAVGSWLYEYSLGIKRDQPGFKHFLLQPEPDPSKTMQFAKGHYDSMYGKIESSWAYDTAGINYHFVVPSNTTATLLLDAASANHITESGKSLATLESVTYKGKVNGKYSYELSSGVYDIRVSNRP